MKAKEFFALADDEFSTNMWTIVNKVDTKKENIKEKVKF